MGETTFHVLLIGIDGYPGPVPAPLGGCVNDIDAIERVLMRLEVPNTTIVRLESPATPKGKRTPASRQNIIAALQALAGNDVAPDHKVLIAYSGHGASVSTSDGQGVVLREAIVPVDAVVDPTGQPKNLIFDLELNNLLRMITKRTQQVTCLFDCCHSASVTREVQSLAGTAAGASKPARRSVPIRGVYSLEQLGLQEVATAASRGAASPSGAGAVQHCVVAAACLPDESAMEDTGADGSRNGLFTRALVRQLEALDRKRLLDLRWGSIWRQVVADVEARQPQHPRLMGSFARRFFGGPPEDGETGFGVRREGDVYRLEVGELAGATVGAEVAVYAAEPPLLPPLADAEAERRARMGTVVVTSARRSWAEATVAPASPPFDLPPGARGRVVKPGQDARLVVAIEPNVGDYVDRLAKLPANLYRFAQPDERPAVTLRRCQTDDWALTDELHGTGETPDEPWLARASANAPAMAAAMLDHYATYIAPWEMSKRCSDLQPGTLQVTLLDCRACELDDDGIIADPKVDLQSPDLPALMPLSKGVYEVRADEDVFCYEIRNHHTRPLFVTLIECGASGRVSVLGGGDVEVPANGRHILWWEATPGKPIASSVPGNKTIGIDRIVAIGTTAKDADLHFLATPRSFSDIEAAFRSRDSGAGLRDARSSRYPAKERWISDRIVIRARKGA